MRAIDPMLEIFSPISPILAVACLAVALLTAWVIGRFSGHPLEHARFQTIDGLRGYLAFFVFLHHASIWFYYLKDGGWKVPPSNLYTHFGQSGVALFFMITAFLFVTKIIDSRGKGLDWSYLFISRFFRLVPLYMAAMIVLCLIIGSLSRWQLHEPAVQVIYEVFRWVMFTIGGGPNINGISETAIVMAGVTWSLPYEWLFYFSLPVIALLMGVVPPYVYLALGVLLSSLMVYNWHPDMAVIRCFWGGVIAAFFVRWSWLQRFAQSGLGSLVAAAAILYTVISFDSIYVSKAQIVLSIAFILIASGSTLFGLLKLRVSKILGEMAYSIYLLHGILLFVLFHQVLGLERAKTLGPESHWLLLMMVSAPLVVVSFITYSFIEKPCMNFALRYRSSIRGPRL